jgi:hypothetical protein
MITREPYEVFMIDDVDKHYVSAVISKYLEEYDLPRVLNDMVALAYADGYSAKEHEAQEDAERQQLRRDFP